MTALHTYFYIVVDTQRGCHTFKKHLTCYTLQIQPLSVTGYHTNTKVDKLLRTVVVNGVKQINAAEKIQNNHKTLIKAFETHHKLKQSKPQ